MKILEVMLKLIIIATVLSVLIILGISYYIDIQIQKRTHNPFKQLRYSISESPTLIAAKFADILIKKFYKVYSPNPQRYGLIVAYVNQAPESPMMIPHVHQRVIRNIVIFWGPIIYEDSRSYLYVYRIGIKFSDQEHFPDKLTLSFIRPNYVKNEIVYIEPGFDKMNKVAIYSNNWSNKIQPRGQIVQQIPCYCKWNWIGIVCRSNELLLSNIWFENKPILYYYSSQGKGLVIASWLPNRLDTFDRFKALIYYHNGKITEIQLNKKKTDYDNTITISWNLPREIIKYHKCRE